MIVSRDKPEYMQLSMSEFKVEDQNNCQNQYCDNDANNPFVFAHPPCHGSQNPLTLANVVVHTMKLQNGVTVTAQDLKTETDRNREKNIEHTVLCACSRDWCCECKS